MTTAGTHVVNIITHHNTGCAIDVAGVTYVKNVHARHAYSEGSKYCTGSVAAWLCQAAKLCACTDVDTKSRIKIAMHLDFTPQVV